MSITRPIAGRITQPIPRALNAPGVGGGIPRVAPADLPALPMTLESVSGMTVRLDPNDAISAALITKASIANAGVYYVKPSTGSNANAGTEAAPFATVAHAMRTATGAASRVVMLEDAVIPSFDLRSTDASQTTQQFKWLDANGFNVVIRDSGPDLAAQTYTQDGTNTKCWKVTLGVSGSQQPTRVLRTDEADAYGYDKQLRKYTSAALLNAGSTTEDGWYWDNTGKVLWIRLGNGEDVEAAKAVLRGIYFNSAGTSRIFVYGSSIGFKGVRFEGVQFVTLDQNSRRPEVWLHDCTQLWATNKGWDGTNAGWFIASDSLCYASQQDGANALAKSATGTGLILTARCRFINSGDVSVFPTDGTIQGVSAHGGTDHASFGSTFITNNGQGVGDTCTNSENDVTWLVACTVQGGSTTSANYLVGSVATSASRKMYLDTCVSVDAPALGDVQIAANGTLYTYNCPTLANISGGTATAYTPDAPP